MGGVGEAVVLHRAEDMTLELFETVVLERRRLEIHDDLLAAIDRSHYGMLAALKDGRTVYGINTGMGYLSGLRLPNAEQHDHQANLLLGRAVGGPPYLTFMEARGVLLARLCGFLSGHAGVSGRLVRTLQACLNEDFVPAIPRAGIGCAGEIIPLAHAFGVLLGIGRVVDVYGNATAAASALEARSWTLYRMAPKEGIALLAGAPGALALAALHRRAASVLAGQLLTTAACAIDALGAPDGPYRPVIASLARDPLLAEVLDRLHALLRRRTEADRVLQAPVSFRVVPQVLTHLVRTLNRLEEDVRRSLMATTDSPAFVDGDFISTGGFYAIGLASAMDALCVALIQATELAGQHIHRLLDSRFSHLADQLAAPGGPQAGLIVVHKRAVGVLNELRRLAAPASIGLADTSLGQEDAMSFAFEAAEKLRVTEELVRQVLACTLLTVRQAWALRGGTVASGLRPAADQLMKAVAPVEGDRPLGDDVGRLVTMLEGGAFAYPGTLPGTCISRGI